MNSSKLSAHGYNKKGMVSLRFLTGSQRRSRNTGNSCTEENTRNVSGSIQSGTLNSLASNSATMTSIPLNLLKMLESLPDFRRLPPLFLLLRFLPYWNVPERHTSQATWAGSKGMTGYGILFFPLSLIFGLSIKTKHNVWKVHLNSKKNVKQVHARLSKRTSHLTAHRR